MNSILLSMTIIGTMFFMIGLHGIDNSFNMINLQKDNNLRIFDRNSFGMELTPDQLYSQSIMITFSGFLLSIVSMLWLALMPDLSMKKKKYPDSWEDDYDLLAAKKEREKK